MVAGRSLVMLWQRLLVAVADLQTLSTAPSQHVMCLTPYTAYQHVHDCSSEVIANLLPALQAKTSLRS